MRELGERARRSPRRFLHARCASHAGRTSLARERAEPHQLALAHEFLDLLALFFAHIDELNAEPSLGGRSRSIATPAHLALQVQALPIFELELETHARADREVRSLGHLVVAHRDECAAETHVA